MFIEQKANDSLQKRFAELCQNAARILSFTSHNAADVCGWQQRLRNELLALLAVFPEKQHPVEGKIFNEQDRGDYWRCYVRFTSRDGVEIPAFLLKPKTLTEPAPAVLCLHGHGPGKVIPVDFGQDVKGRPVTVEGERDFAVQAVQHGYIALAPDLRGFGELMLNDDLAADRGSSCQQLSQRALITGRTLLGMRVLDCMAAVDFLQSLPEVDSQKIVCTGQSGGGTATLFSTALDTRFAVSVPSCYFCTFEHSIMAMSHCDCNYAPGLLNLCEMYDIAGLVAPRPMLIVAGEQDNIFPIEGVRIAYEKLQAIYRALGAENQLELYVGPEGHRYYKARVWDFVKEKLGR